jgi:membrane protein implicated in regulation of membrane protease activity
LECLSIIEAGETIQVVAVDGIKLTVAKTTQEV